MSYYDDDESGDDDPPYHPRMTPEPGIDDIIYEYKHNLEYGDTMDELVVYQNTERVKHLIDVFGDHIHLTFRQHRLYEEQLPQILSTINWHYVSSFMFTWLEIVVQTNVNNPDVFTIMGQIRRDYYS